MPSEPDRTFSLAANDAPIVTHPSALVIISGVQDTCPNVINGDKDSTYSRRYLLNKALEVDVKQPVHFSVVIVVSLAALDAENIVPEKTISRNATAS